MIDDGDSVLAKYKFALKKEKLLKEIEREKKKFGLAFFRPHARQHRFFEAGDYKRRLTECGNRGGKCLAKGTLVATPQGAKRIEDIKAGDLVYNKDGKEIKVKALIDNGVQEVWNYTNRGKIYATAT